VRTIDGDTIEIAGRRVRLAAVDAPELDQLCDDEDGTAWRCGAYAAAVLMVNLAKAKPWMVTCTLEPVPDRYGRGVGVCTVPGGNGAGPVDIASVQVLLGFAVPAYKYGGKRYEAEYAEAKLQRRGMHAGYFEPPADYRQRRVKQSP
jgi:endonuclease YncB( thermonuclease family)